MSFDGWRTALVLGGIRSGKSAFAESLAASASTVRYVATATELHADTEWAARLAAHRARRPGNWATEEIGAEPDRLTALIAEVKPDEVLLVDDLGGWVTAQLDGERDTLAESTVALADAIRACAGRLVVVSPEVGLSVVPATAVGRLFADELGRTNLAVADACDDVVLVVAGQPAWLKRGGVPAADVAAAATGALAASAAATRPLPPVVVPPAVQVPEAPAPAPEATPADAARDGASAVADALHAPTLMLPALSAGMMIQPGINLPLPDEDAAERAKARVRALDVPRSGLGDLTQAIAFAAGTQRRDDPAPWQSVRVLLVHGDHAGGAGAGDSPTEAQRRARQAAAGEGPLGILVAEAGASLQVIEAPAGRPIEDEDAITAVEVHEALTYGWRLADDAADSGVDLLVIAACGAGADTAAAAVTAAITGAEPVSLLGRVDAPDGRFDDLAWMVRCAAVRDALNRTRARPRGAHDLLAALGGGDIAVVAGALLGAASRRTPVLVDGPVAAAAGLVAREIGGQARHWCLMPDHGGHPTVRHASEVLGLKPLLDLHLGLGEGTAALTTLPLLRAAVTLAGALPPHPALRPASTPAAEQQPGTDWPTGTEIPTDPEAQSDTGVPDETTADGGATAGFESATDRQ